VIKPLDNTYFGAMGKGADAAAQKLGVTVTTVAAKTLTDNAGQASQVASLIVSGEYGCYIVNPVSPTNLLQPLADVTAKGQPIINIDLPIDLTAAKSANVTVTSYLGSDNVATGAAAGEQMAKILPAGSKVALIGGLAADPGSLARMKGFSDAVSGKLVVTQTVAADADRLKAQQAATQIMNGTPDIKGFFTVSGDMSLGISQAIASAGKQGSVVVIGIDGTEPQLKEVQSGVQPAAVEQFPYLMGWQGVEACVAAMKGKTIPANVPTPVLVVTKDTAADALAVYPAPPASFNYTDVLADLIK